MPLYHPKEKENQYEIRKIKIVSVQASYDNKKIKVEVEVSDFVMEDMLSIKFIIKRY